MMKIIGSELFAGRVSRPEARAGGRGRFNPRRRGRSRGAANHSTDLPAGRRKGRGLSPAPAGLVARRDEIAERETEPRDRDRSAGSRIAAWAPPAEMRE